MKRILYLVFQEMKKEASPLLEPALMKILKDNADADQGESNPEPKKQCKLQGRQSDTEGGGRQEAPHRSRAKPRTLTAADNGEKSPGPDSDAGED